MDINTQLLQEQTKIKTALKHEMLISNIASMMNSSIDFDVLLNEVLDTIKTSLVLKDAHFVCLIPEINNQVNKSWLNTCYTENTEKTLVASINTHISESRPLFWNDYTQILEANRKFLTEKGIHSFAIFPIKVKHVVTGFIAFESEATAIWDNKYYSLFNTITNLLANFLDKHIQTEARLNAERENAENIRLIEQSSRLATIGLIASGITHEINQPLNAIKVISDGLLFQQKQHPYSYPEDLIQKIRDISIATDRINEISKQMKAFSNTSNIQSYEKFDVHETIHYALNLVKSQTNHNDIDFDLQLYPYKTYIIGNKIQFEQIIINLCINSIQSLQETQKDNKKIIISSYKKDDKIKVSISDNGVGIKTDALDRVFEPFYTTKKAGENMGLGLAIVKMFVDEMNGSIKVVNNEDGGGVKVDVIVKFEV